MAAQRKEEKSTDPLVRHVESVGRRCFACCSRDARDAEGRAVDREHDRARMRTTGNVPQATNSHPAQVCDTHERLGSDSEVVKLEQVSTGICDPSTTDALKKPFLSRRLAQACTGNARSMTYREGGKVMHEGSLETRPSCTVSRKQHFRCSSCPCSNKRAMACTARALPFSVTVEQESFSLSRRLVQLHLQAEHRQCHVESEESTREFTDAQKNGPSYAT